MLSKGFSAPSAGVIYPPGAFLSELVLYSALISRRYLVTPTKTFRSKDQKKNKKVTGKQTRDDYPCPSTSSEAGAVRSTKV